MKFQYVYTERDRQGDGCIHHHKHSFFVLGVFQVLFANSFETAIDSLLGYRTEKWVILSIPSTTFLSAASTPHRPSQPPIATVPLLCCEINVIQFPCRSKNVPSPLVCAFSHLLISSHSIRVFTNDRMSLFLVAEQHSIASVCPVCLIHPSVGGHPGQFFILAAVNSATANRGVQMSLCHTVSSWGYIPSPEIAGIYEYNIIYNI